MNDRDKDVFEEARLWDLPSVEDAETESNLATNALNRPRGQWKYEAPEEEQEIKPLTAEDIEAIRESAYKEGLVNGHQEGFEKGHAEGLAKGIEEGKAQGHSEGLETGLAEAKTQIDEQCKTLASLFEQISLPLAQINEDVKKELIILAVSLAKAVINVEIESNDTVLLKAIEAGIAALPANEKSYQLEVHPDDIAIIHLHYNEQLLKEKNWILHENTELTRGGCKIVTHNNAVDVSIARRCENVLTQLLINQGVNDDPRAS